ncbi:GDSL-like Lipase/Acylhydrolase [compost metagenome]
MNILPHALSILCYGDSNTYGQKPDRSGRFAANERWTGVLQEELGDTYYVIEEGLGGRTTDLEHPNLNKPGRNGLTYFKACLESHSPVDVIIIMLGTNDLKTRYERSVDQIADAIEQYVDYINTSYADYPTKPKIVIVSPPYMNDAMPLFHKSMPTPGIYDHSSVLKSHELAARLEALAKHHSLDFVDAARLTDVGEDGCHITTPSHRTLGHELAGLLRRSE